MKIEQNKLNVVPLYDFLDYNDISSVIRQSLPSNTVRSKEPYPSLTLPLVPPLVIKPGVRPFFHKKSRVDIKNESALPLDVCRRSQWHLAIIYERLRGIHMRDEAKTGGRVIRVVVDGVVAS